MTGRGDGRAKPAAETLEALAEARLALLALARRAHEIEGAPGAKDLAAKAEALKAPLTALRRNALEDWSVAARGIEIKIRRASERVKHAVRGVEHGKSFSTRAQRIARAAGALVALWGKIER